jgi:hypothetical protein
VLCFDVGAALGDTITSGPAGPRNPISGGSLVSSHMAGPEPPSRTFGSARHDRTAPQGVYHEHSTKTQGCSRDAGLGSCRAGRDGAQRASLQGPCSNPGRICVWNDADWGPDSSYQAYATQVTVFPFGRNNEISSVWNRYSQGWIFYDGPNFTSPMFCLMPGAEVRNLMDHHNPAGGGNFNDRISSARRTGYPSCPAGIHRID